MTLDRLRKLCLAQTGATEQIQWGADLVFKEKLPKKAQAALDGGAKSIPAARRPAAPVETGPRQ